MDRTLKRAKRGNKRRNNRNYTAWRRFSPDGVTCRFCPHDNTKHLCQSGQPHFYRKATEAERNDPSAMLYRHYTTDNLSADLSDDEAGKAGGSVLVKRMVVANRAELITAFCTACAEEIGTTQALCYQRTLATGEVVGV